MSTSSDNPSHYQNEQDKPPAEGEAPESVGSERQETPSGEAEGVEAKATVEADAAAAAEGTAAETEAPEEPLDPIAELTAEVAKWRDTALRTQAELENFRKRMQREKAEAVKFANGSLLGELLPVVDNFNFGLEAARKESESSVVYQGMSMVMKQVMDFLADHGVQEVPAVGQPFDPNVHDAVQQEFSESVPEGQVISVIRKGFRLHDRLLRAANVVVSKGPEKEASVETAGE